MIILFILLLVLVLFVLVLVHEYGHFITARFFKMRVDEFGFGYPPRAKTLFKRGNTVFTLNWLPFGGFVKIFGENPNEEMSEAEKNESFTSKPKYAQAIVLFAGIFFNFLLAGLLFSATYMTGRPVSVGETAHYASNVRDAKLTIIGIDKNTPAEQGGLLVGDHLLKLQTGTDTLEAPTIESVIVFVGAHGTAPMTISYERGKEMLSTTITPKEGLVKGRPAIGIAMDVIGTLKLPPHLALVEGFKKTGDTIWQILSYLGNLIRDIFVTGKPDLSAVAGPVGIVGIIKQATELGFVYLLSFIAAISANLAIINLLPFPALDGGRLFFLLIEVIIRRKIPAKAFNIANTVGFFMLILLMIGITYHDIANLIR